MKTIILIFVLFSTSLIAKDSGKVCDWIITGGGYQEYLDDMPPTDFYSAFHVVVGNDGRCEYGWRWNPTTRALENVIQESFNDCEKWKKGSDIEGECKPYDINKEIVWGKPEFIKELIETSIEEIKSISGPPYDGTIFHFKDVIKYSDPTTFKEIVYVGQYTRKLYDKRKYDLINNKAYLFDVSYDDGLTIQIQVNSEFKNSNTALNIASKYAKVIGQLPTVLRNDVHTVTIHKGDASFGGGSNDILIHSEADSYILDGQLEETLIHEASHVSLNWPGYTLDHGYTKGWRAAQKADDEFISTYAKEHPTEEDIAESFLVWMALRYRTDRISESDVNKILLAIPNRIKYFDEQEFDMYPIVPRE